MEGFLGELPAEQKEGKISTIYPVEDRRKHIQESRITEVWSYPKGAPFGGCR